MADECTHHESRGRLSNRHRGRRLDRPLESGPAEIRGRRRAGIPPGARDERRRRAVRRARRLRRVPDPPGSHDCRHRVLSPGRPGSWGASCRAFRDRSFSGSTAWSSRKMSASRHIGRVGRDHDGRPGSAAAAVAAVTGVDVCASKTLQNSLRWNIRRVRRPGRRRLAAGVHDYFRRTRDGSAMRDRVREHVQRRSRPTCSTPSASKPAGRSSAST